MPLPVLTPDVLHLILEQLVEPIVLFRYNFPFYDDLCSASLVCRDWREVAQKLLWRAVYLCDEGQAETWLAVKPKAGWVVRSLVLEDLDLHFEPEPCSWSSKTVKQSIKRASQATHFASNFDLRSIFDSLSAALPELNALDIAGPYRGDQPFQLPPRLDTLNLSCTAHDDSTNQLLEHLVADLQSGRFSSRLDVRLGELDLADLSIAPHLKGLHVPVPLDWPVCKHQEYIMCFIVEAFLPACTFLERITLDFLWSPSLVFNLPASVKVVEVLDSERYNLRPLFKEFEERTKHLTQLKLLRICDSDGVCEEEEMQEKVREVEADCERRGIRLEVW
ncbi:hypothetical protein JCM10213_009089 [Rhodosporidiobolus nylandii]